VVYAGIDILEYTKNILETAFRKRRLYNNRREIHVCMRKGKHVLRALGKCELELGRMRGKESNKFILNPKNVTLEEKKKGLSET